MRSSRAWILALGMAAIAVVGFLFLTSSGGDETEQIAEQPQIQLGDVVVVKQDVAPRTVLTAEMIEVQQIPAEYIHPMSLVSIEDAIDMITLVPISAGEQLLQTKIADPKTNYLSYKLREGYVAFTVPVSELTGAGGMIKVGDKVNVLGNFAQKVTGKDQTKFVLYDIQVIAIGKNMAINGAADNEDAFSSMTVEVTPEDAQKLAWAQNNGSITFILKSVLDKEGSEDIEAVTAKTFFGETKEFKDLEYLEMINHLTEIRGAEQGLAEFGRGDIQQVRKDLNYTRFYYDDLNPDSKKSNGNPSESTNK